MRWIYEAEMERRARSEEEINANVMITSETTASEWKLERIVPGSDEGKF